MTKDEMVRFTFRMPNELMHELKQRAKKDGHSLNAFILQILGEWIKKNESTNRAG